MSFKKKMHDRGISKLDNLVETPNYITPKKPVKTRLNWLKFAVSIAAGLVVLAVPISLMASGVFNAKSAQKSSNISLEDGSSDANYGFSPSDSMDSVPGESGSAPANNEAQADEISTMKNKSFADLLAFEGLSNDIEIEIYNYAEGGYTNLVCTITGNDASSIINSLKTINSDYDLYTTSLTSSTANRNENGRLLGINHKIVFRDSTHKLISNYYSQFTTLASYESGFNITNNEAFTILDTYVEMDYDSTYDETILH